MIAEILLAKQFKRFTHDEQQTLIMALHVWADALEKGESKDVTHWVLNEPITAEQFTQQDYSDA